MINIVFKIVVYLLLYMTTVNLRIDNCVLQQGREFFYFLSKLAFYCFVLLNQHSTRFYNIRGATALCC